MEHIIITNDASFATRVYRRFTGWVYTTRKAIARKLKLAFYTNHNSHKKPLRYEA